MLSGFFSLSPAYQGGPCMRRGLCSANIFFLFSLFLNDESRPSPLVRPCKSALLTSLRYPILPQIIRHSSLMQLQPDYWASLVRVMHVGMACFPGKVLALLQDFNHLTWEVLVPSGLERLGQRLD